MHGDAEQAVGSLHRAPLVRHDEQLGLFAELGDEAEEAVQVHVVEGGLDLVHHVERARAATEDGEQERQRGKAALATRQQRQLLHVLARRLRLDLDAGREKVFRVREMQLADATGEQHGEELGEVLAHVGVRGGEHALDLGVDRSDHPGQLAPRRAHVFELRLEERVALLQGVELLEGERVDRPHQAKLALQVAHPPGGRRPLGQHRQLGGHRPLGLDVVLATQGLDGLLDAQLDLGLLDLGAALALAQLFELLLGRAAGATVPVERGGDGTGLLALATATLLQLGEVGVDHGAPRPEQLAQRVDRAEAALQQLSPFSSLSAGHGVGSEAALGLGQAGREEALALLQSGGAHRQIAPTTDGGGHRGVEPGPRLATSAGRFGEGRLVGLQAREQVLQLGDAGLLAGEALGQLVARGRERFGLGAGLAAFGLGAVEPVGGGGEATVVGVEPAGQLALALTPGGDVGPAGAQSLVVLGEGRLGGVGPTDRFLQRRARRTG